MPAFHSIQDYLGLPPELPGIPKSGTEGSVTATDTEPCEAIYVDTDVAIVPAHCVYLYDQRRWAMPKEIHLGTGQPDAQGKGITFKHETRVKHMEVAFGFRKRNALYEGDGCLVPNSPFATDLCVAYKGAFVHPARDLAILFLDNKTSKEPTPDDPAQKPKSLVFDPERAARSNGITLNSYTIQEGVIGKFQRRSLVDEAKRSEFTTPKSDPWTNENQLKSDEICFPGRAAVKIDDEGREAVIGIESRPRADEESYKKGCESGKVYTLMAYFLRGPIAFVGAFAHALRRHDHCLVDDNNGYSVHVAHGDACPAAIIY